MQLACRAVPLTFDVLVGETPAYSHRVEDELMRFFERCRGFVEGVENNRTALLEVEKFKHGEQMEAVRRRIAEMLGLPFHRLTPGQTTTPSMHF